MLSCLQDKFTGYGRRVLVVYNVISSPPVSFGQRTKSVLYMTAIDRSEDGLSILQTFKGTFGCGFFNIT